MVETIYDDVHAEAVHDWLGSDERLEGLAQRYAEGRDYFGDACDVCGRDEYRHDVDCDRVLDLFDEVLEVGQ